MRMRGKTAIITGAATGLKGEIRGIGGATAWAFVREGATVYLADINDELGERTTAQIRETGGAAHYVHLDVTDEALWQNTIDFIVKAEGALDVLVNNAGTGRDYDGDYSDPDGPQNAEEALKVEFTTVEGLDRQLGVHVRGAMLGMKYAIPEMRKRGGGSIINVSSIHGIVGVDTITSYSTAKAGMRPPLCAPPPDGSPCPRPPRRAHACSLMGFPPFPCTSNPKPVDASEPPERRALGYGSTSRS